MQAHEGRFTGRVPAAAQPRRLTGAWIDLSIAVVFHDCGRPWRDVGDGEGSRPQRTSSMILRLKSLYGGYRMGASKRKLRFITGLM